MKYFMLTFFLATSLAYAQSDGRETGNGDGNRGTPRDFLYCTMINDYLSAVFREPELYGFTDGQLRVISDQTLIDRFKCDVAVDDPSVSH